MIYFTADTHFDHTNIIHFYGRKFETIEEMNETIINNWNKIVTNDDTIYHLGDFAFAGMTRIKELIGMLNGNKIFVRGNHDKFGINEQIRLNKNEHRILLTHDPVMSDARMLTLCGHVHENFKILIPDNTNFPIINVGVDVWDFKPVSFNEIIKIYMESFKKER